MLDPFNDNWWFIHWTIIQIQIVNKTFKKKSCVHRIKSVFLLYAVFITWNNSDTLRLSFGVKKKRTHCTALHTYLFAIFIPLEFFFSLVLNAKCISKSLKSTSSRYWFSVDQNEFHERHARLITRLVQRI